MIRIAVITAALFATFACTGAVAGDRPADVAASGTTLLARALPDEFPIQTCLDGTMSASGCSHIGKQVATGNECPAASGKYCSDETPYCCGTPGHYYCAIDVNHC